MLIILNFISIRYLKRRKYLKIINIVTSEYLIIIENVQNSKNIYLFSIQRFKLK